MCENRNTEIQRPENYLKKRMVPFGSRLLLLRASHMAFAAELVAFPTDMSTYFTLHGVVGRRTVAINTESRGLAIFILDANGIGVCVSVVNITRSVIHALK